MGADVIALVEGRLQKGFSKVPSDDWNHHLSALKTGECAVAPTIVRTTERERYAFFTTPYATVPVVIITTRGAGHGRTLDAFVENLAVAAYYIDQGGIPNLRVAGRTDYAFAFSIGVSRKYPLLYSAVQNSLAAIPETELEAIRKKWISLQVHSGLAPETKRLLALVAAFTVLLVLGLTTISYFLKRRLREKVDSLRTAQQELAHSEARFRAIFDHAPYAIVINSLEDGRFLEANKAFLNSRDVNKDDMTQLKSTDLPLIGGAELKTISERLMKDGSIRNQEAHDFNNMLGAIIGYAELVLERMAPADPARVNLGKILDVAHRSANLTRQLLAFARKQTVEPVAFDLNESVEALLKRLRRLIGEDIELAWLPGTGRCTVYMDPTQLDQTLTNLCVNARDAIADVGTITIKTATVSVDETSCEFYGDCVPGDYVLLVVSDTGCGMDEETKEHLFEPFFTTKGVGQGSGLGLAMVYGIVKQNHGFIHLESRPGRGTTFSILLPHHPGLPMQQSAAPLDHIPESKGETILLVEDDPILREMGQMMLLRLGYVVLSAATPGEAIRIVENGRPDIHLFITDVVMPEMNGGELADRLLSIRPSMKHLFMSGYTADVIVPRGVSDVGGNFIQKPFTMRDLAVKVRSVLDYE